MSWANKNGTWVWTPDGKGNPNKAGDNVTPPPVFGMGTGGTGGTGSTGTDNVYALDLGFGIVDAKGNPVSLPPIQIGPYITALAGTNPALYARVKAAVSKLSGRTKVDPNYVGGYISKLATSIIGSSDILAKTGSLEDYFKKAAATATGAQTSVPQSYVSSPTQAKADINSTFKTLLGREATDKEVKALTGILNDAQKKNPSKYVNGVTYGGLDKNQFLVDIITSGKYAANSKAAPDILESLSKEVAGVKGKAATAKEATINSAAQQVQSYAKANGIPLSPEDLNGYATRVANGESIDNIASTFRKIAALSHPKAVADLLNEGTDLDTIYKPYKTAMATTLELNPNDIQLTDPALTNAITGDKTMTTYEFQRTLRKDPRWQYTNNARSEASDVATQVLKDFGFMG